jgi:hypothetical protein
VYTIAGAGGMNSQKFRVGDENGIAILLGLFILFVVTIVGVSLTFIAQKDKVASVDSASIRKVAFAADASFKAFESQLQLKPDTVAAILTKYSADTNYKWLLGSSTASARNESKLVIGTSELKCSARITAYDKAKQLVQIQGIGYGGSNEQKNVFALYQLRGVQTATAAGQKSNYVLYLAGNGRNFDARIDVAGNVFCGTDFHFNAGASNSAIHGNMKTGLNRTLESSFDATGVILDSALYLGTGLRLSGALTCKSKAGIEGTLVLNTQLTVQNEAWINDTNQGAGTINMSTKTIHHSGRISMARVISGVEDNTHAPIADVVGKVGLGSYNDSAWWVDTSGLIAKAIPWVGSYDAATLQTAYNSCSAANKVNGYMVIHDLWGSIAINPSATVFSGKVLWILRYGLNVNQNLFNMDTSSRMLIYGYQWATFNGFGGPNLTQFNGLLFLTENSTITISWVGTNTFKGAIHLASPATSWQCNGGGTLLRIIYDEPIIAAFETMGRLRRPSQGAATAIPSGAVVLTDCKIRPQLVSVRY